MLTDEQIGVLNVVPEVLPDFLLRGTRIVNKVAADLNVGSVDDGKLRANLLDERDEARHLGII